MQGAAILSDAWSSGLCYPVHFQTHDKSPCRKAWGWWCGAVDSRRWRATTACSWQIGLRLRTPRWIRRTPLVEQGSSTGRIRGVSGGGSQLLAG